VNGQSIGSCLGDLFSVSWMEDVEANDITQETLGDQFETILSKVIKSHPMQWGDTSFTSDDVSDFIGSAGTQQHSAADSNDALDTMFRTRHVDLGSLYTSYQNQPTGELRLGVGHQMHAELTQQLNAEVVYRNLVTIAYPDSTEQQELCFRAKYKPDNMDCEKKGHQTIRQQCAELFDANSGFALQFHQQVVNVCHDIASEGLVLDIEKAATEACQNVATHGLLAMSGVTV